MSKNRGEISVRGIVIKQKNNQDKLNPNSLRFLLAYILCDFFRGNIASAVRTFREFGGKYKERKNNNNYSEYKQLNRKNIEQLLKDEGFFTYWHLEILAKYLRIPTGILLVISRFHSYQRYDDKDGCIIFINCMRQMLDKMEDKLSDELTERRNFQTITECFSPLHEHDSKTPMLF